MKDESVRFIRLQYKGGDWDQDMGVGADHNLLVQLNKFTGFRIAENTESIPIRRLKRFPNHRAPPFVFITGGPTGGIKASTSEIKTLRWYCLEEGGMIFADNGGGNFNGSFRRLMRRVFPMKQWEDISNKDTIYQQPFHFPNGAPPMWCHSGTRALGIQHQGRWVVFYHQGDLNDAWKNGHSGVSKALAMQAYKMGLNVMVYAFDQYTTIHFGTPPRPRALAKTYQAPAETTPERKSVPKRLPRPRKKKTGSPFDDPDDDFLEEKTEQP